MKHETRDMSGERLRVQKEGVIINELSRELLRNFGSHLTSH